MSDGGEWSEEQYSYDEATGRHSPNPAYEGTRALFELPLDKSKADPARAAELLEQAAARRMPADETAPNDFLAFLESLSQIPLEKCTLLEDSVKACIPDAEGKISYTYSYESEECAWEVVAPDRAVAEMEFDEQGYCRDRLFSNMGGFFVGAFHRDGAGEITAMMWIVPEELAP